MSGQWDWEVPKSNASTKTRQEQNSSGVLTPGSEAQDDGESFRTRKRKRESVSLSDPLNDPFVVKPYPSTVTVKPRTLRPIALLPRDQLPLSCLDLFPSKNPLPETRLFEARIKILDLESRMQETPVILLARLDDGKSYYAIEIESRGLYVMCKIGAWVDIANFCGKAILLVETIPPVRRSLSDTAVIQTPDVNTLITPESSKYTQKKRLAIEAFKSVVKRPSIDMKSNSQPATQPTKNSEVDELESQSQSIATAPLDDVQSPSCNDIMENLRTQYLETLYLSKASLAYFAKGPLSRARAAFHLDIDSTLEMKDLIEFLSTLVLPTTVLEKKYKEAIPNILSTIDIGSQSANEGGGSKKRKLKKMKLGKGGLYTTEDDLVRRWWESFNAENEIMLPGESLDVMAKKRVTQLRTRETQLQMIVILETLAIQSHSGPQENDEESLPSMASKYAPAPKEVSSKMKKPRDLAGLVDVHVDRLCIWQSVASEVVGDARRSDGDSQSKTTGPSGIQINAADVLREFCIEVIVPFYSARLPDICSSISRKLGGPVALTPGRPKAVNPSSTSLARPGAVTKRPVPTKQPRSLRRALTDDRHGRSGSRGPSGAISLMRSATLPSIPGLKREVSETPSLASIPSADLQSMYVSRSGVLKSKSFSSREIDLNNLANGSDSKTKKALREAEVEAELKNVISAIRKPNRQLAGQAIVDNAERRTLGAVRKSKKPVRNPLFQGVQIMATPKTQRQKNMMGDSQSLSHEYKSQKYDLEAVPPSSLPRIPQSIMKPTVAREDELPIVNLVQPKLGHRRTATVPATPSRGFLKSNFDGVQCIPPSSPLQARPTNSQQYLSVSTNQIHGFDDLKTPTKVSRETLLTSKPLYYETNDLLRCPDSTKKVNVDETNAPLSRMDDDNLFKTLGWDDYDDLT